jgi:hypothetical protein
MDFNQIAGNLGVPVALLVALGLGAWKVASFIAPLITASFSRFWAVLDQNSENMTKHGETMTIHAALLSDIKDELSNYGTKLTDHSYKLDSHGVLLNEIRTYVRKPGDSGVLKSDK